MNSQAISNRNKDNSKNIKYPHTLGRKSFARKRKEVVIIDFIIFFLFTPFVAYFEIHIVAGRCSWKRGGSSNFL
jgi:hypothetical protein